MKSSLGMQRVYMQKFQFAISCLLFNCLCDSMFQFSFAIFFSHQNFMLKIRVCSEFLYKNSSNLPLPFRISTLFTSFSRMRGVSTQNSPHIHLKFAFTLFVHSLQIWFTKSFWAYPLYVITCLFYIRVCKEFLRRTFTHIYCQISLYPRYARMFISI